MNASVKPHLETTIEDYKAYEYHIRESAKEIIGEKPRLSIWGIYAAVTEKQAAELAALKAENERLRQAGRNLVNSLPTYELDLARKVWGNTNVNIVEKYRDELAVALKAKP
jgi:hypothetical protein